MEATAIESAVSAAAPVASIQVIESPLANAFRVEVTPPGMHRPLLFRVFLSSRTFDWIVHDPFGATLCRATTVERGIEVVRHMGGRVLALAINPEERPA